MNLSLSLFSIFPVWTFLSAGVILERASSDCSMSNRHLVVWFISIHVVQVPDQCANGQDPNAQTQTHSHNYQDLWQESGFGNSKPS